MAIEGQRGLKGRGREITNKNCIDQASNIGCSINTFFCIFSLFVNTTLVSFNLLLSSSPNHALSSSLAAFSKRWKLIKITHINHVLMKSRSWVSLNQSLTLAQKNYQNGKKKWNKTKKRWGRIKMKKVILSFQGKEKKTKMMKNIKSLKLKV